MTDLRVMVIGEKPTFLTKVVCKKITESGTECNFVPWTVNDINNNWENTALVIMYMEEDERPSETLLHFIMDKMADTGNMMIPIGTHDDIAFIIDHMRGDLIYRSFRRPVNNEELVSCVKDYITKTESGEFKKSLLVVDDDASFLGVVRDWLKDSYKVSLVNSGIQAIKWLAKNKVDLILLDYEMPVTSGPQVLEMLRNDPENANIPVMFLTGKGDKESVMKVLSLKPEGYFLKTIEKAELIKNLNDFFVRKKAPSH